VHFQQLRPSLCVSFQFLVYCSVVFFCRVGVILPRGLCWFILGVTGGKPHDALWSPVGLPNVSQAGLEPLSGGLEALLFSQCNVAWRSFPQVGVQDVKVLILLALYFCQVWFQRLSEVLESQSSCCLLLRPNHHHGSFPWPLFFIIFFPSTCFGFSLFLFF
jgi:hypothetical protein